MALKTRGSTGEQQGGIIDDRVHSEWARKLCKSKSLYQRLRRGREGTRDASVIVHCDRPPSPPPFVMLCVSPICPPSPPVRSCSAHRPHISRRPPEELESIHALRTPDLDKFLPPKVGAGLRGWGAVRSGKVQLTCTAGPTDSTCSATG